MNAKRIICLILAILLTACSLIILFPNWLRTHVKDEDLEKKGVSLEKLSMTEFPFYGGKEEVFGIRELAASYKDFIAKGAKPAPNIGNSLLKLTHRDDFIQELYAFFLISLLTIPVYMLIRLIIFDGVYEISDLSPLVIRFFIRGIFAAMASIVTVFVTWFLYRTVVFDIVLSFLIEKLGSITNVQFALNATNIFLLVVIALGVIALLRQTLFRGSIMSSILGCLMRTLLFVILIAVCTVFIPGITFRTVLFLLVMILVIGILKTILLPEKKTVVRR